MKNIYTTAKPFYLPAKIFGLFPLTFTESKAKTSYIVKFLDVFLTSLSFIVVLMLIYLKLNSSRFIESDSLILVRAWNIGLIFDLTGLLLILTLQVIKRNDIKKLFTLLRKFDDDFKLLGLEVDAVKHRKFVGFITVTFITINTLMYILLPISYIQSGFVTSFDATIPFTYSFFGLYKCLFVLQFSFASLAIRERFKMLNNFLK